MNPTAVDALPFLRPDTELQEQIDELRAMIIEQADMLQVLRQVILAMGAVAGTARLVA